MHLTGKCTCAGAANGDSHASVSPAPEQAEGPRTPADWVEALVQQMAGAKDVADARERASQVLQAFEQAVLKQAARSQVPPPHSSPLGHDSCIIGAMNAQRPVSATLPDA